MNAWEEVQLEREDAKAEGRAEGKAEGKAEGRAEGQEEERGRLNTLIVKLKELNRPDDVFKAAEDPEYQKQLLKEFGL